MPRNPDHFLQIFYFVCGLCGAVIIYLFAVTFLPVPKENMRNADTAIAYLFGVMSTCAAYLVGSSPNKKEQTTNTSPVNIEQAETVNNSSNNKTVQP